MNTFYLIALVSPLKYVFQANNVIMYFHILME